MDAILTGAGLSSGTINVIQIPKIEIAFTCDEDDISSFGIGGFEERLPVEVVFAPNLVKGREIITWALSFSAPFKVMNFLYVTSPEVRYVFVASPSNTFAQKIKDNMPEEVFTEIMAPNELDSKLRDLNNYKIKFIFFKNNPEQIPISAKTLSDDAIKAIKVDNGKVTFYKKVGNTFQLEGQSYFMKNQAESVWLDEETLYGAIFSEDLAAYECNLRKMLKRLDFVTQIYAQRETTLKSQLASADSYQARCSPFYSETINYFQNTIEDCITIGKGCDALPSLIPPIERDNEDLKQKSCPLLY